MSSFVESKIDTDIYDNLGDRWYTAKDDPVALLRAESNLRNPWVSKTIRDILGDRPCNILDIGCGAGFLSGPLARLGHTVTGIDLSESSLEVARRHSAEGNSRYIQADAATLPFSDGEFDVVCAMDFLEHVEDPAATIAEASRVLKKGGLFFFHTFNRNWISRIVAIWTVEKFIRNTPPHLHLHRLFIKPEELRSFCGRSNLEVLKILGVRPVFNFRAFMKILFTGEVPGDFSFKFTSDLSVGYSGVSQKS